MRVVQGRAWDVAVDIRQGSPTFGQWVGVELTGETISSSGFQQVLHGFVALEDNTQFLYKTTNYYSKECECSIVWDDETINIEWPIEHGLELKLTDKDKYALSLKQAILENKIFNNSEFSVYK